MTGGASGIGRATAVAFAREGTDVVVADILDDLGRETVSLVEAEGSQGLYLHVDVGVREEVESLVERAIGWQGRCDVFMSNAAIACSGPPEAYSVEDWERVLDVNLWASIWAQRLLVPHMLERGSGHLVFVSSGQGFELQPQSAPYGVSKSALIGLAAALAKRLKGTGVKVSVVVPGAVGGDRQMWRTMRIAAGSDEERIRAESREMSRVWPSPESMAATIVDGIEAGRFFIWQIGAGPHENWERNMLADLARDPDAFVLERE